MQLPPLLVTYVQTASAFGAVRPRSGAVPWQVVHSTLPGRKGKSLEALPDAKWTIELDTFSSDERQLTFESAPRR